MNRNDSALLVVDIQERLTPVIHNHVRVVWNASRLIAGAKTLGVPIAATEQYPQGLGHTVAELAMEISDVREKIAFSCGERGDLFGGWRSEGRSKILITGIETHICVQQSVLDLREAGFSVYVAADAVGSRRSEDHERGLLRMADAGATITTTEAALFEICERAGTDEFKVISKLVRNTEPSTD